MSDVKLKATIEGDSKPMQNALDKVEQSAKQASQTVQQSATNAGQVGQAQSIRIGDAVKHPIQTIKTLASEAKKAALALLGMGQAGKQASAETKQAGQAMGALIGAGSKMAIIAKGFQALKTIINDALITPLRDGYKEMMRLAGARFNMNSELIGRQVEKWRDARTELAEYYKLYQKASAPGASAVDKENERRARTSLSNKGIDVDPDGMMPMEKQLRQGIEQAQKQYIKGLESKLNEAQKAEDAARKAFDQVVDPKRRLLYGSLGAFEQAVQAAQAEIQKYSEIKSKIREELVDAQKHQNPGADFSSMVAAEAQDRLAAELDRETKARDAAAQKEAEAAQRLTDAENRRAEIESKLEKEGRLEAMQHTRKVIDHKLGRFGFQLNEYDDENMAESTRDRIQRRRNIKLDARIQTKLERQRRGKAVHFTSKEQARIDEQNALRQQGKELTAEEKAMAAAEKEEQAAKALQEAADNINKATADMEAAKTDEDAAQHNMDIIGGLSEKFGQERDFYEMTSNSGSVSDTTPDYGGILSDIRDYLKNDDKVYVVK